jgi:hypothetical protein
MASFEVTIIERKTIDYENQLRGHEARKHWQDLL